jgi:hypothetical protein
VMSSLTQETFHTDTGLCSLSCLCPWPLGEGVGEGLGGPDELGLVLGAPTKGGAPLRVITSN